MKTFTAVSLAALMASASLGPALAQTDQQPQTSPEYQQQWDQYQQQRNAYEQQQQRYQDQRSTYEDQRQTYEHRRRAYEYQLRAWREAARDYDAEYGPGAYEAIYPQPQFEVDTYEAPAYPPPPAAGRYDRGAEACADQRTGGAVAGGVIGGIAGAVIGSNIAGRGDRAGGAVLGGVVGAAGGAAIGASAARCDRGGWYWTYDQTYPYREGDWEEGPSGEHDYAWYRDHGCRLAIARGRWEDQDETRYVRVCPDPDGRYRLAE